MNQINSIKLFIQDMYPMKKSTCTKNNWFYDKNKYRWYTYEENIKMIQVFSKRIIDFWDLINDQVVV